jgi:curli biogenesis system outer membrane secretion channel CsgG
MKNLLQVTLLVAGLAGLSACASSNAGSYEGRTAGSSELAACEERVARLEEMNRSCYRK